jgi:mycofactocin glycosyltransferase
VVGWQLGGPWWTLLGLARAMSTVVAPGLCVLVAAGRGRRWAWAAVLLVLPATVDWWQRRPGMDPVRWAAVCLADDLAYGAGVWAGCIRARTVAPLLPAVRLPEPLAAARRAIRGPKRRPASFVWPPAAAPGGSARLR